MTSAGTAKTAIAFSLHASVTVPVVQPRYRPTGLSVKPHVPLFANGVTPQVEPSVIHSSAEPSSKVSPEAHSTVPANSQSDTRTVSPQAPATPLTSHL